jgi:hypothetical protein
MKLDSQKILMMLLLVYGVVISILLVRKPKEIVAPTYNETLVKNLRQSIDSLVLSAKKSTQHIDSIKLNVTRIELGIASLNKKKDQANADYKKTLLGLKGLKLDSLKQIALKD